MQLETIIGLEIHIQLKTKSKMFCGCSNEGEDRPPNTTICEVCLGHPGVLPIPNKAAIEMGIKAALALGCEINPVQVFDRKNYYYPDLPKGYQISQFALPIGERGELKIKEQRAKSKVSSNSHSELGSETTETLKQVQGDNLIIRITRLHIEEDAAKNTHFDDGTIGVDYNRGGTPLIEIVTEPDFRTPEAARAFLQELRLIMRYLDVSDADMEKGHLRVDANISLRPLTPSNSPLNQGGEHKNSSLKIRGELPARGADNGGLHPKTELKNMNSFKAVERALAYEIQRQRKLWEAGTPPDKQSTRGWDENAQTTTEQRTKEESHDYRYFPEPDIPSIVIEGNPKSEIRNQKQIQNSNDRNSKQNAADVIDIEKIKAEMPELPGAKRKRFREEYGVSGSDARTLTSDIELANYFEQVISEVRAWAESEGIEDTSKLIKLSVNWLINKLGALIPPPQSPPYQGGEKGGWSDLKITPENFAELVSMLAQGKINSKVGREVLTKIHETGGDPSSLVEAAGLEQMGNEEELLEIIQNILEAAPGEVAEYHKGKETLMQFFVGQVMKETKGKANPQLTARILKRQLRK